MIVDWEGTKAELKAAHEIMRPFQRENVTAANITKRHIFSAKMGCGKTLMGLTSTVLQRPKRILVVCSKNALWTWKKELAKWYPSLAAQEGLYCVVRGTPTQRAKLWSSDSLFKVCTYGTLLRDIDKVLAWDADVVIADEFHRGGWKNHKAYQQKKGQKASGAKGVTIARQLARKCRSLFLLSGSATRKGPRDYWGPLHLCAPKIFPSYWRFVYAYHQVENGVFGKQILGPKNIPEFRVATKPYLTHIPKKVIEANLPKLTRVSLIVEMSPEQKKFYIGMDKEMYTLDSGGSMAVASTTLTKVVRLRQVLCCPKILNLNDYGAGLEAIVDKLQDAEDNHCIIYTPFTAAIPYMKEYLDKHLGCDMLTLQGGADMEEVRDIETAFNMSRDPMICSLLFAQSFELDSADILFFLGYDYDQNNNEQAEGRPRRMTRAERPITAYYIKHKPPTESTEETVDDRILEILNTNTQYVNQTHGDG